MSGASDHSAVLDGLQLVVSGERDAVGTLTAVPADIFVRAGDEITTLRKIFAVCTDPMTGPFRTATERIEALQQHVEDLIRMRSQKILLLALSKAEGRSVDREDIKRMLPAEQHLFEEVYASIEHYRRVTLDEGLPYGVAGEDLVGPDECAATAAMAGVPVEAPHAAFDLARVLSPVEPFLGFDGRTYALEAEDIVTLPPENAAVLRERNIILSIFPDK